MIDLYHQTKIPISFWCRQGLNPKSLIQPSETLPIELTRTHLFFFLVHEMKCFYLTIISLVKKDI